MAVQHRDVVLAQMKELGLRLNAKKSVLSQQTNKQIKLRWALFVTYTIIQSIMRSELCSLHLTHLEQWAADCAAPGEQSWTSCRSQDSKPQPWVTSGFKYNALSIRPMTAAIRPTTAANSYNYIVQSPLQRTTYLGVVWDSTTMQAWLSPAQIESILTTVRRVREGLSLTVKQFQRLLGLMAAASNVIPFGLLYMRPLQWWLKSKGFSPRGNPFCMIKH